MKKPTVSEVLQLVNQYYSQSKNSVGGNLHIVIEDGNIDNYSIKFCLEQAKEQKDEEGIIIANLLLQMSKTQRKKIYMQSGVKIFYT